MISFDLIVVGEGLSGLACANHAARAGLKVATFESDFFGGLVLNVNELEGFDDAPASGMDMASQLASANAKAGVKSVQEAVASIQPSGADLHVSTGRATFAARAVVIASGARVKKLGVPGEAELEGKGVSHCADCDGPLFRDENVAVAGGGDSAFQEALVLAVDCAQVHVVYDGERPTARPHFVEAVKARSNIRVHANCVVEAVLGDHEVTGVRVRAADGSRSNIPCKGVFAYIGLEPNAEFAPQAIERDAQGYLKTNEALESTIANVWVVGQARAGFSGLARDGMEEGRRAAEAVRSCLT